jgi:hypothetical protein
MAFENQAKLYWQIARSTIDNSILAIYGLCLWKPSEIVLFVDKSLKL